MTEKKPIKKVAAKKRPPRRNDKPGRPAKYTKWITDDGLKQVKAWAREGLYDYMIAKKMGIHRATLVEWQATFPALCDALEEGRDQADRIIENAMFKSAQGYDYTEETEELTDSGGLELVKRVTKKQAPNVSAQIFWLKNRQPTKWRDKHEVDQNIKGAIKVEFDDEMEKWSE